MENGKITRIEGKPFELDNLGIVVVRQVSRYSDLEEEFNRARAEHRQALLITVFVWWENLGEVTTVFGSRDLYISGEVARGLSRASVTVVGGEAFPKGLDLLEMKKVREDKVPPVDKQGSKWEVETARFATYHPVFERETLTWNSD